MIDFVLLSIGVLGISFASIADIKSREIPDWLCYSMIVSGLGIRAISSFETQDYNFFLSGLLGFFACFLLANALYYTKQWGGGDSKLLMGVGAVFGNGLKLPFIPPLHWPFLLVFLLNLFILGALYALIYGLGLAIYYYKNFRKQLTQKDVHKVLISFCTLLFVVLVSVLFFETLFRFLILSISFLSFILFLTFHFIKKIEKAALERWIPVEKLTEGDWVLQTVKTGSKRICGPEDLGLEKTQIKLLKKHHIKKVLIKEGIPFVPSFFLALLFTLFYGNLLLYLF